MSSERPVAAPRMIEIACFHGWALDATLWTGLRTALAVRGLDVATPDRGYFGNAAPDPAPDGRRRIAVGHSLGLLDALASDLPWAGIVAINGFPRFPDQDGLARMQSRLPTAPEAVVRAFHRRCGLAAPPLGALQPSRLAAGLERLASADATDPLRRFGDRLRVVAGTEDPIMDRHATAAAFDPLGCRIAWIEGGGHLLAMTHAEACADAIADLLAGLDA